MLKLVVVEDEVWMREALRSVIDWTAIGIEYAGEAEDGRKALQLIEAVQPDIVMVDIQMPLMDGITLLETLQQRRIRTNVIIVSAYRDFEYARKSLQLEAFDYILKPVYEDQLLDVMQRLVNRIHMESKKNQAFQQLESSLKESLPLARRKFLEGWISGEDKKLSESVSTMKALGFEIHAERIGVVCIQIYDWAGKGDDEESRSMIRFAVGNIAEEVLNKDWRVEVCPLDTIEADVFSFVAPFGESATNLNEEALQTRCEHIEMYLRDILNIHVSIGISCCASIHLLKYSCIQALSAASLAVFEGYGKVFHAASVERFEQSGDVPDLLSPEWRKSLIRSLQTNDKEAIVHLASDMVRHIDSLRNAYSPLKISRQLRLEWLSLWDNWKNEKPFNENAHTIYFQIKSSWIAAKPTLATLQTLLLSNLAVIQERHVHDHAHKRLMDQALAYIGQHYRAGVTLNDVAEQVHVSPWHFSKLFHEIVGITFSQYIVQVKMQEAKNLLQKTGLKIYEIADLAGYKDVRHFVKTFKEVEGVTPTQYRNLQH